MNPISRPLKLDAQEFPANLERRESGIAFRLRTLTFLLLLTSLLHGVATPQGFWEQTSGPGTGQIVCLAVDQQGTIFAATASALFRSSDRGAHWLRSGAIPTNSGVHTLCAAGEGRLFLGTEQGVLRSTDLGTTWESASPEVMQQSVRAIRALDEKTLIAGASDGVFRSTDAGSTWTFVYGTGSSIFNVLCIAGGPHGELYIGTGFGMGGGPSPSIPNGRVLKSADSGLTWDGTGPGRTRLDLDRNVLSVAVDRQGYVYAIDEPFGQITRSTDGGTTWQNLQAYGPVLSDIAVGNDGHLYLALQSRGILRSTNAGASWDTANTGLPDYHINVLVSAQEHGVFAGTGKGVTRWDERVQQWVLIGIPTSNVTALGIRKTGELLAGTAQEGLCVSTDNGSNWMLRNPGPLPYGIRGITSSPAGDLFLQNSNRELLRSTDVGVTWDPIAIDAPSRIVSAVAVTSNGNVFVATYSGVYYSTNNGTTWHPTGLSSTSVYKLISTRADGLIASSSSGIHRSTDFGKTWSALTEPGPSFIASALAEDSRGRIFVATGKGLYRGSVDGGLWENLDTSWTNITSLITTDNDDLFVGVSGTGVFQSSNSGKTWLPLTQGLTSLKVNCLAQSSTSQLFLGTSDAGVFRSGTLATHVSPRREELNAPMYVLPPYPNPFNGYVTVGYTLSRKGRVVATIFNSLGEVVLEALNRETEAGSHAVYFDGSRLASGVYFCRIQVDAFVDMTKLVLLR
jgi:photosystem II stability/assembly factor-like uncharacterized protein